MKIVVYKDNLTTGRGADHAVAAVCGYLASEHDVTLLTETTGALSATPDSRVRLVFGEPTASARRSFLEGERPDLVLSAGVNEILNLADAFPGKGCFPFKTALQFHVYPTFVFKWKHPIRNARIRRAIRRCAAVQVLLPCFEEVFRRTTGYAGKIVAIGNACSVPAEVVPQETVGGSPRVIVYPAALNRSKRQELLIRALAHLPEDVTVELYGSGKPAFQASLRKCAAACGVADRVHFMGYAEDLASVYARADAVAFPSACEGFGMVLVEAAACGRRAVACRDCAASAELVPRLGGLLADPDSASYAAALSEALAQSALPDPEGVRVAVASYAPERIAEDWKSFVGRL